MTTLYLAIAAGLLVCFYAMNRFFYLYAQYGASLTGIQDSVNAMLPSILENPFFISGGTDFSLALGAAGLLGIFALMLTQSTALSAKANKYRGTEYGSAHWLDKDRLKEYRAKKFEDNILLSQHFLLSRDKIKSRKVKRDPNRHMLVEGGSGSWKSSAVLDPNILQLGPATPASFIVGDPKGTAGRRHIRHLLRDGYRVKIVDFLDFSNSLGMNVFSILRTTADIPILATMIIDNTTPPEEHKDFWTRAEHGLYLTCIGWLFFFGDEESKNLPGLIDIVMLADASEENEDAVSGLDMLIEDVKESYTDADDEYYVVRCYDFFKKSAGKTAKSILSSCGIRLAPFNIPEVRELTMRDELEIGRIGEERTVLFCNFSATSKAYSFLVAFLFNSLFVELERCAADHGGRLPVGVTMHMDEVAQYGRIKDLEVMIAFLRGMGINLVLYVQADSQLNDTYGEQCAKTIMGNCDTTLFLGSVDYDTCEKFSKILGNETIEVETVSRSTGTQSSFSRNINKVARPLKAPEDLGNDMFEGDRCIVKIKQEAPFEDKKTNVFKHPRYSEMDDDLGRNAEGEAFDFGAYLAEYRLSLRARRIKDRYKTRGLDLPLGEASFEGMYEGVKEVVII